MTFIQGFTLKNAKLTQLKNLQPQLLKEYSDSDVNIWIDIAGFNQREKVEEVCQIFGIHNSITQDIIHSQKRRPKIEILDNYVFWIFGLYDNKLILRKKPN